mgnify:CR=1 FL=1
MAEHESKKDAPRLLVVDDETNIRIALNAWFTMHGFEVDQASDGLEAVKKCEENEYDVITMDMEMPGMKGADATALIRGIYPEIPIVVLTGFAHHASHALENGASMILTKPIRLKELEQHVRALLAD